jgi:hypothetical protein
VQIEKLPSSSTKSIYSLLLHLYQSSPTDWIDVDLITYLMCKPFE